MITDQRPDGRCTLIAHITGTPGAGKTTLLSALKQRHPRLVTRDTDDFDDEAAAMMGCQSHEIWDLSADDRRWHQALRQVFATKWLEAHAGLPIVTCGYYWTRPEHPAAPAIAHKVRLDTGPWRSAWRAWRRERRRGVIRDGFRHWLGRARRQIARLDDGGYVPRSEAEIIILVDIVMSRWPDA